LQSGEEGATEADQPRKKAQTLGVRIAHGKQRRGILADESSLHKPGEQGVRPVRPRPQFRVSLGGDIERVNASGKLNKFHQGIIRRHPRKDKTGLTEDLTVRVIYLITVPVALVNYLTAIQFCDQKTPGASCASYSPNRIVPPHVTLAGHNVNLFGHRGDHRIGRFGIKFATRSAG